MKNYQTYNFSMLVLLVTVLILQGCDQTITTPNNRTQSRETSTRNPGIKRKAPEPIEVEIVSQDEFKDIEYAMKMAEQNVKQASVPAKRVKQTPTQNVATSVDDTYEEKKECGCSRTFHEYSSFPGGSYSYYTCPYHQKKEQEERNEKKRVVSEHKALLEAIKTVNIVPLQYAIDKYKTCFRRSGSSDNSIRRTLLSESKKALLEITKKSNRWVCSQERVDAVNFALLDGHVDTTASTMWGGWRELRGK